MEKKLLNQFKDKLEREKKELERDLESVAVKDPLIDGNYNAKYPNIDRGEEANADEVNFYEQNLSQEQHLEKKLADIKSALLRVEKGDYGKCLNCGKEISEERLKAYPEAKYCIGCEEKLKK